MKPPFAASGQASFPNTGPSHRRSREVASDLENVSLIERHADGKVTAAAIARLRQIIEHPDDYGVRSFPFHGARVCLVVNSPWAEDEALYTFRELFETGAFEVAGFACVTTWKPE